MLKDLKQSNNEAIAAMRIRQERLIAKTIIDYFLNRHTGCALFWCPLGRKSGTGNCGPGWAKMTHSECINKVYEWFKEKVKE